MITCSHGHNPIAARPMNHPSPPQPLLDEAAARFLQGGLTIFVASRDRDLRPAATVACGCRVAPDRREVTIFLNGDRAAPVLDKLRATGVIAVNLSQPSTHRSLQLKGDDAREVPVAPTDLELIAAYRERFAAELATYGYPEAFAHTFIPAPNATLTAVAFTPSQAYDQTPGQHAGQPLK